LQEWPRGCASPSVWRRRCDPPRAWSRVGSSAPARPTHPLMRGSAPPPVCLVIQRRTRRSTSSADSILRRLIGGSRSREFGLLSERLVRPYKGKTLGWRLPATNRLSGACDPGCAGSESGRQPKPAVSPRKRGKAATDDGGCLPLTRLRSPKRGELLRQGSPMHAIGRRRRLSTDCSPGTGGRSWPRPKQRTGADAAYLASWSTRSRRSSSAASWPTGSFGSPATVAGKVGLSPSLVSGAASVRRASATACAILPRIFATTSCPTYAHLSPRHMAGEADRVAYPEPTRPARVLPFGAVR
jgi:hypothetical protein